MPRYVYDAESPPVWTPLEQVARICALDPELPTLDLGDFMYMAVMLAPGLPSIHLYKHYETRRYLSLDEAGHTYAYVYDEPFDITAEYVLLPDLCSAVRHVLALDGRRVVSRTWLSAM